jgi:hypothetical protein
MRADALSCRPDFNTGNPMNNHLIVLPLNRFIGMPEAIRLLLNKSMATSEITLSSGKLESEESLALDLDCNAPSWALVSPTRTHGCHSGNKV